MLFQGIRSSQWSIMHFSARMYASFLNAQCFLCKTAPYLHLINLFSFPVAQHYKHGCMHALNAWDIFAACLYFLIRLIMHMNLAPLVSSLSLCKDGKFWFFNPSHSELFSTLPHDALMPRLCPCCSHLESDLMRHVDGPLTPWPNGNGFLLPSSPVLHLPAPLTTTTVTLRHMRGSNQGSGRLTPPLHWRSAVNTHGWSTTLMMCLNIEVQKPGSRTVSHSQFVHV